MRHARPLALLVALSLAACGSSEPTPEDGGTIPDARVDDDGASPDAGEPRDDEAIFEVWEELRARLRESPDHRVARAEARVAEGDAGAIFAFVRDEIGVVPRVGSGPLGQTRGAGPRATLRSGVGTPLDKVELLVDLLRRAGHEAEVRFALVPSERRDSLAMYLRDTRTPFAPPIGEADLTRWRTLLGRDALPEPVLSIVDPEGTTARGWADAIEALAPPAAPLETDPSFDGYLPLAWARIGGEEVFAEPLFADATLGARVTSGTPSVRTIVEAPAIHVRLWAERNHGAGAVTLVERSYQADALIGRRMVVRTAPTLPLRELLRARPDDVGAFLPILEVGGPGTDAETSAELSAAGTPITLSGERLEADEDGTIRVEGVALSVDEDESARLARVASLAVSIDARGFEEVRLRLDARGAAGEPVEGLSGRAFEVSEDGARMGHALRRNRDVRRVVLLFDDSTSIPDAFDDEARVAVGLDLARVVLARPGGEVQIATVGASEAPGFTADLAAVESQLRAISGGSSTLWRSLADAARRRPDAIVLVSDARATDLETDAHRGAILRAGAPVLVLRTSPGVIETADRIAALSGGAHVPVEDAAAAEAALESFLPARAPAYELGYRAPLEGAAERVVRVALAGTEVSVEARYTPPPPESRVTPPAITGLFVTVRVGDVEVTRSLGGARPGDDERTAIERTREALLGRATLLFETGAPSPSILLDEWLTERLALRPLSRARGDYAAFVAAAEQGLVVPSADAIAFAGFAPERTGLRTSVVRPRVAMIVDQPRFGVGRVHRIDLLPQTEWATVSPDGAAAAWRATLEQSLHMAALESARGATSTGALLEGEALVALPARDVSDRFAGTPLEARWAAATSALGAGTTAILPADGEPVALWALRDETGSALGLLEDGSGGTYEVIRAAVERNLGFFDMIEQLASSGVVTGGVWLDLELAKARIVSWATLWIGYLGEGPITPPPTDAESPEQIVGDFVEGQVEDAVLGALPGGLGDAISEAQDWYGLVSGALGEDD